MVLISEWSCGLGYGHAGREMTSEVQGHRQNDTCDPTGTISFPHEV